MNKARYLREFTFAYVETALWASTDDDGEPLDDNYGPDDLSKQAQDSILQDCWDFVQANWDDLRGMDAGQAGHDFLLTRDHHGTGFWDRGLGEPGDRLTKASKPYGSSNLYVGDDGLIYV